MRSAFTKYRRSFFLGSLTCVLGVLSACGSSEVIRNPSTPPDPISYEFQLYLPYYDGFGFGFGVQANRKLTEEHHFSAGLSWLLARPVDVTESPGFYFADTAAKVDLVLFSLPLVYRYRLELDYITPYVLAGITPSLGGPYDWKGVGYGQFITRLSS